MTHFFKLENTVQHYDWGSPRMIPELTGLANPEMIPWAELWMGIHPAAPSFCIDEERGRKISLPDLIQENPDFYLGDITVNAFGTLPFLYKILSADKPLSIQAHPNLEQAKEGFERENKAGIGTKAPNRNYKDANHKPEMMCALSPFTAMCGFREPAEIEKLLGMLDCRALDTPLAALKDESERGGLKGFFEALFAMNTEGRKILTDTILANSFFQNGRDFAAKYEHYKAEFDLCVQFAQIHPEDPSIIAPLYLNLIELKPGEAIFLSAGVLHSYVHGFGIELMANSDNVLRGGLTVKNIDAEELKKILLFTPFMPKIQKPVPAGQFAFSYIAECKDFALQYFQHSGERVNYINSSPSIIFITKGNLTIQDTESGKELVLHRGESAFLPPAGKSGAIMLGGDFEMYSASTGLYQ